MDPDTSLYIHIPFCTHRCAYCDFNTYAGQEDSIPAYVNALIREIEFVGRFRAAKSQRSSGERRTSDSEAVVASSTKWEAPIHTVFFGGGTPSLLSPAQFESIFRAIRANLDLRENSENTIEANPGTVSLDDLKQLRQIGINRISFGVQSANTEELRMLERIHDFWDVIEAVTNARKAGFTNLNLDLIYGLPEQTLQSWQTTLQRIVDLHPEHISAYALTLEHGTPFGRWSSKGLLPLPDPDLAAEMYEYAEEFLEQNDYVHYEISNWALRKDESGKPVLSAAEGMKDERTRSDSSFIFHPSSFSSHPSSFACKHNLQYWQSLPYLGLGAGAHGYANGYRYSNALRIKTYIERLANLQSPILQSSISNYQFPLTPATVNQHKQTPRDDMSEFMLNNLRLVHVGATESAFRSRFGRGLMEVYPKEIEELVHNGLLEWQSNLPLTNLGEGIGVREVLRLTKRGRLLGNQVFMEFI